MENEIKTEYVHTLDGVTEAFKNKKLTDYEILSYDETFDTVEVKHSCGTTFCCHPNHILDSWGCPACAKNDTETATAEIYEFIKSIYPNPDNVIKDYYDKDDPKDEFHKIDIYIPEKKTGIIYDNIYYKSFNRLHDKKFLRNQTFMWHERGIRILHILSDEWNGKKDIVKDRITVVLGCMKESIYARNCKIVEITSEERTTFLNKYHIQGGDRANISVGLEYNGDLVAVYSLVNRRIAMGVKNGQARANQNEYELSRYATSNKYGRVVGGASKLQKYCIKKYNIKKIVTYYDLRLSNIDSTVYYKIGFNFDPTKRNKDGYSFSDPDYYYVSLEGKKTHRFNHTRQKCQKRWPEFFAKYPDTTEKNSTYRNGLFMFFDCGNAVLETVCDNIK